MPIPSFTDQDLREEVELLKDVQTAIAQVQAGQGIPQEEARREATSRLMKIRPAKSGAS